MLEQQIDLKDIQELHQEKNEKQMINVACLHVGKRNISPTKQTTRPTVLQGIVCLKTSFFAAAFLKKEKKIYQGDINDVQSENV